MTTMDAEQKLAYKNDRRIPCIFGLKCYQKNPIHHEKYKHPPKPRTEEPLDDAAKRRKVDEESKPTWEADRENFKHIQDPNEPSEESTEPAVAGTTASDGTIDSAAQQFIKEKFLVDMPPDFYDFWKFCTKINESNPLEACNLVGLYLVGPFDVLAKKFENVVRDPPVYLRHWRYYYDPPEFQTILKTDSETLDHYGYYRDSPNELPCFIASGHIKNGELSVVAENIFGAVNAHIDNYKKTKGNVFKTIEINNLQKELKEWAAKNSYTLDTKTPAMQARDRKVVAKTFHGVGIVVPFNKKTQQGYRPLNESDDYIKKLLKNIVENDKDFVRDRFFSVLQPLITYCTIATDECDFGTSLELGLDLFSNGGDILHETILNILKPAYKLLGRHAFLKIIESHFEYRTKKTRLSVL